jgi:hypothetical protein
MMNEFGFSLPKRYDVPAVLKELGVPFIAEFVFNTFHGQRYVFDRKYFKKVEKAMPGYARAHNKQMAITTYAHRQVYVLR